MPIVDHRQGVSLDGKVRGEVEQFGLVADSVRRTIIAGQLQDGDFAERIVATTKQRDGFDDLGAQVEQNGVCRVVYRVGAITQVHHPKFFFVVLRACNITTHPNGSVVQNPLTRKRIHGSTLNIAGGPHEIKIGRASDSTHLVIIVRRNTTTHWIAVPGAIRVAIQEIQIGEGRVVQRVALRVRIRDEITAVSGRVGGGDAYRGCDGF